MNHPNTALEFGYKSASQFNREYRALQVLTRNLLKRWELRYV